MRRLLGRSPKKLLGRLFENATRCLKNCRHVYLRLSRNYPLSKASPGCEHSSADWMQPKAATYYATRHQLNRDA
jgi:hypothetical protein